MSAKGKKLEVFNHFKKVKGAFLCQVEESGDVCGAKPADNTLNLKRYLERHHVDIFKSVDKAKTSQTTASNATCKQETSKFFTVKKLLCQ